MNKRCVDLNNATGEEIDLDLHAECKNFTQIFVDTPFNMASLTHLKRCPNEIGSFLLIDENFTMCKALLRTDSML